MIDLLIASLGLWAGALTIGAADGLYFHLWKFRLYARPASQLEHVTHTIRACLLGPMLWFAFVSANLWALIALVALDSAVVLGDVSMENESRRALGGIPTAEYLVHVMATALHSAAVALAIGFWWKFGAAEVPVLVRDGALLLIATTVPVAVLHLALVFWKPGAPPAAAPIAN
jgi:hypothetical protein